MLCYVFLSQHMQQQPRNEPRKVADRKRSVAAVKSTDKTKTFLISCLVLSLLKYSTSSTCLNFSIMLCSTIVSTI